MSTDSANWATQANYERGRHQECQERLPLNRKEECYEKDLFSYSLLQRVVVPEAGLEPTLFRV